MFQIWSPYPKEINKDRKIFKVNSNEFFKLFKDMKINTILNPQFL